MGQSTSEEVEPATTDGLVSRRLLEEYEVGQMLGEGAFGVVYSCRHRRTEQEVAVKMVDKVETPIEKIMQEAMMLQALSHSNIVKFHGVFSEKCFVCIVMDKYSGGDLIDGLQEHLKERGKINCFATVPITKQMAAAIQYLHNRSIVHRDIKGDNYLMDRKDIIDPACHIVLTDFGAAVLIDVEERLSSEVGTKIFWAPESFGKNYGKKVDIWAMGVTLYGLLDGHFPFNDEKEIMNPTRVPRYPKSLDPACVDYLKGMLCRDEAERFAADDLISHRWVSGAGDRVGASSQMTPQGSESPQHHRAKEMRDYVNDGVMERRRELLERLNHEHAKGGKMPIMKDESQHFWANWFTIADKRSGTISRYEWWEEEQVRQSGILNMEGMAQQPEDVNGDMDKSPLMVGQMLRECNIDITQFGKGQAKTLEQLAAEVQSGAARLMLDATDYKKLVRVVDVVLLRLYSSPEEEHILVETGEQYPDGRRRETLRMPGAKKLPHETSKEVAQRVLKDFLNMGEVDVHFNFHAKELYEEEDQSPSFPGVTTVYRKEIVCCYVKEMDMEVLKRIGLPEGNPWSAEEGNHNIRYLEWMTVDEAISKNVKLRAEGSEEVSGLVLAPIGLSEEDLVTVFVRNHVDPSKFGPFPAKTLKEFSAELIKGESTLMRGPDGALVRVVDIVLLKLLNPQASEVLVHTEMNYPEGLRVSQDRLPSLPGTTRRPDENQFLTVKRILRRQLKIDENHVKLNARSVRYYQEEKLLPEYPGIVTVFRRRVVSGRLRKHTGE